MEPTKQQYVVVSFHDRRLIFYTESACQGTEQLPNSMINHLPDELLLMIFDSYRQIINPYPYDSLWKKKHGWFNLAHVCRKWRAIMFASSSRLQLGISAKPENIGDINLKTVLSDPLPIFINFKNTNKDITSSALRSMRAALKRHRGRVGEIAFEGVSAKFNEYFKRFSKVTKCTFPALESLSMDFGYRDAPNLINTFLQEPDLSDLPLRRLRLRGVSFASISGLLSTSTSLTDLYLLTDFALSLSSEMLLVACLQGMSCLRRLSLFFPSRPLESPLQPSTPKKDTVLLSNLTRFMYSGPSVLLNALTAGISAPSLRDFNIQFLDAIWPPIVHLPRYIDEMETDYDTVHVAFLDGNFRLWFLNQSEPIYPCFELGSCPKDFPESIIRVSTAISTRLSAAENLFIVFDKTAAEEYVPWRWFLQQFPSVKILRTEGENNYCIARSLLQGHEEPDDDPALLPALEEIELCNSLATNEIQRESELAAFEPFVYARQQAGRPVNISLACCQTCPG